MYKSEREPNKRNPGSFSKSNKAFKRRNKKSAKARKEQVYSPDESADLKFKRTTNGVVDRTNQMKSKQKMSDRNEAMPRKNLVPKPDRHVSKQVISQPTPSPKLNNSQQKRKAPKSNGLGSKSKKPKKHALPESDSDADDYLDQFFEDASDDDEVLSNGHSEEEEEDDDLTESSEDGDDEEADDNAMSLEELVDYFGHRKDEHAVNGRKQSKKIQPQSSNGWVEEDNDVELVYKDSDDEVDVRSRALVPFGDVRSAEHADDTDDDDDDEEEDNEEFTSDDSVEEEDEDEPFDLEAYLRGELDFGEDTDSSDDEDDDDDEKEFTNSESFEEDSEAEYSVDSFDGEEEESELDDHEFSSDYDSDEDDDDDDSELPSYWDESYDSEDDEDYVGEDDDDLYICRGTARVYNIDDNEVSFNSDVETAQIVELPVDDGRSRSAGAIGCESQVDDSDEGGCPLLVPIYDAHGNLIDKPEKLGKLRLNKTKQPDIASTVEAAAKEDTEEMEEEVEQNGAIQSSYRFYDAINMRLSLLVLKNTLYFSGHLTIQPLVGGLEVMGYNLSPGECRSAFAVRGFHSLNLTPRPQSTPSSNDAIGKVMARLEKHFHDADLKDLLNSFDSSDSVLVLLQADSNNKRIDTVEKYLSEDFLFPKVEYLKKSVFYRTEYLLNVEFFSEHVDKGTSLYRPDPEWDKIVAKCNSKMVVIGGKGSGKSTLCQYLINKNVEKFKKVVLIDLDIGQPIQHVPETISVTVVDRPFLGVATFNPIPPVKSWLFGSLDIVSSLIFYTQNVRQLLRYCEQRKSELGNVPWIINTMGYVSDFGEELMTTILRMLSPTDVIQLVSTEKLLAIPNFQNRFTSEFVNRYSHNILRSEVQEYIKRKASFKHYELNICYPKKGFTLNAPKRRNMMLLAHLADILQESSGEWFNEVKPFCAPLKQLQVLITREDQTLGEDQLPSVLNATLVYLCRKDDTGLYECLGIGIVRGVDKNNNVYLLQSLPDARLAEVNVLAICSSSLPNAVFLRQSARIQGTIPYVYNIN